MVIAFTKVSLPYGWLGNMAPYPITYDNKEWRTSEALFQALRFKDFPDVQEKIREQKSPMAAKMVSKPYRELLVGYEYLGEQDIEYMNLVLKLKLEQHVNLQEQLYHTGNDQIIEDCTARPQGSGLFWGAALQIGKWVGDNVLGELWMIHRARLIFG